MCTGQVCQQHCTLSWDHNMLQLQPDADTCIGHEAWYYNASFESARPKAASECRAAAADVKHLAVVHMLQILQFALWRYGSLFYVAWYSLELAIRSQVVKKRLANAKGKQQIPPYQPCQCVGGCKEGCPCTAQGHFCEKFCACGPECESRFKGCVCKGGCSSRRCPCLAAGSTLNSWLCTLSA